MSLSFIVYFVNDCYDVVDFLVWESLDFFQLPSFEGKHFISSWFSINVNTLPIELSIFELALVLIFV